MPDGEVFTSPVETETEGEIRFTLPAVFYGREVEDIRLRFEGGRVVDSDARSGADYLRTLDTDEGARVLGEFAFGLNYEIDRWTRNILFDEKIGGTVHLALGSGFDDCGSKNDSALHWDIICDLREEGEIYADGELVWRAGQFLEAPTGRPACLIPASSGWRPSSSTIRWARREGQEITIEAPSARRRSCARSTAASCGRRASAAADRDRGNAREPDARRLRCSARLGEPGAARRHRRGRRARRDHGAGEHARPDRRGRLEEARPRARAAAESLPPAGRRR